MKVTHLVVSGRVQGVGYRAWCQKTAASMDLVGWVKNNDDGTVEVMAAGEQLEEFVELLWKGPLWSKVTGVHREEVESAESFDGFRVVR